MSLDISQSYLAKVCTQKLSFALQPAYAKVAEHIRNAHIVGSDETGHKNPTFKSAWTWCQQTCDAVFFHISNSRGSKVLVDILGADFNGIVTCDYYWANKKFVNDNDIPVQFCLAHLIRDIKFLTTLTHQCVVRWAAARLGRAKAMIQTSLPFADGMGRTMLNASLGILLRSTGFSRGVPSPLTG